MKTTNPSTPNVVTPDKVVVSQKPPARSGTAVTQNVTTATVAIDMGNTAGSVDNEPEAVMQDHLLEGLPQERVNETDIETKVWKMI